MIYCVLTGFYSSRLFFLLFCFFKKKTKNPELLNLGAMGAKRTKEGAEERGREERDREREESMT